MVFLTLTLATWIMIAMVAISVGMTIYSLMQTPPAFDTSALEARKGAEVVIEGKSEDLPLVYGRALVGGSRVFHAVSSDFNYVASNADKTFATGVNHTVTWFTEFYLVNNPRAVNAILEKRGTTGTTEVLTQLAKSINGRKNEFLYFQQALCQGPIGGVIDVVLESSRYLDDATLATFGAPDDLNTGEKHKWSDPKKARTAVRIDVHYDAGMNIADSIIAANFPERSDATFNNIVYASATVRTDRDDPQFSAPPRLQFYIEGKKVRKVVNGVLNTNFEYSNNPAWCLLDYLLDGLSGASIPVEEINLPSFEAASLVCDYIVAEDVTTAGKIWQNTEGTRNIHTRDLPLYECNMIIDTKKPIRDNITGMLTSMGDARLIWSQGQYRLSLQYTHTSNDDLFIVAELGEDDLVLDQEVEINLPSASDRLNYCTVKFHNELSNFKEDSVSWPPKFPGKVYKGVGGKKYPISDYSYTEDNEDGSFNRGANLLNSVGVWGSTLNTTYLSYYIILTYEDVMDPDNNDLIKPVKVQYTGDNEIRIRIKNKTNTITYLDAQHKDWKSQKESIVTLPILKGETQVFHIEIDGTNTQKEKAVAARIVNGPKILWTTRESAYSDVLEIDNTDTTYSVFLEEDGGTKLEMETSVEAMTDPYHAAAKAEEYVRMSRSSFVIKFKYVVRQNYLEPGDFVKLTSPTLNLAGEIFRVNSVKIVEGHNCEVTAQRFDHLQLAWSQKDDQHMVPPNIYSNLFNPPRNLKYIPTGSSRLITSGTLVWDAPGDAVDLAYYIVSVHEADGPTRTNNAPIFRELGRVAESSFVLPKLEAFSAIFSVMAVSTSGRRSTTIYTGDKAQIIDVYDSYLFDGLTVSRSGLTVNWTACNVYESGVLLKALPAGTVTWTEGLLFIYFDFVNDKIIKATTDYTQVYNGVVLATFDGVEFNLSVSELDAPTVLTVEGRTDTVFDSKDAKIVWQANSSNLSASTFLKHYLVQVLTTADVLKKAYVITPDKDDAGSLLITDTMNLELFGTLTRSFKVRVYTVDSAGLLSATPKVSTITNAAPLVTTLELTPTVKAVFVKAAIMSEDDIVKYEFKQYATETIATAENTITTVSNSCTFATADDLDRWYTVTGYDYYGVGIESARVKEKSLAQPQSTGYAFLRYASDTAPVAPTGGTYLLPVPTKGTATDPLGTLAWSDGIPDGTARLWQTARIFTANEQPPHQTAWQTPVLVANSATIKYQYSSVNPPTTADADWADGPGIATLYMRVGTSKDGINGPWVWGAAFKVKGEAPQSSFVSTVFARATGSVVPDLPTGGTYPRGLPAGSIWKDGIPGGTGKIYTSSRLFTSDALTPQDPAWSTVTLMVTNDKTKFQLNNSDPISATGWYDSDDASKDPTLAIYMRINYSEDGGTTWTYGLPSKIKGEKGDPSYTSFISTVFTRTTGKPLPTPVAPTAGTFATDGLPNDGVWVDGIPPLPGVLWSSYKTFTNDPNATAESWSTPVRILDDDKTDYQFSVTNSSINSTWQDDAFEGAVYMRIGTSVDGVSFTYGPGIKIKGEKGDPGLISFKSTVFTRRAATNPVTAVPTGGSFDSPRPGPDQIEWEDGIPEGDGIVWQSYTTFVNDPNAATPAWSTPKAVLNDNNTKYYFNTANVATGWVTVPSTTTEWMRIDTSTDGFLTTVTGTPFKIKGEQGETGYTVFKSTVFTRRAANNPPTFTPTGITSDNLPTQVEWVDGIPPLPGVLWESHAYISTDPAVTTVTWSEPKQILNDVNTKHYFATTNSAVDSDWSLTPSTTTEWMRIDTSIDGFMTTSVKGTPFKIKGEKGETGSGIDIRLTNDLAYIPTDLSNVSDYSKAATGIVVQNNNVDVAYSATAVTLVGALPNTYSVTLEKESLTGTPSLEVINGIVTSKDFGTITQGVAKLTFVVTIKDQYGNILGPFKKSQTLVKQFPNGTLELLATSAAQLSVLDTVLPLVTNINVTYSPDKNGDGFADGTITWDYPVDAAISGFVVCYNNVRYSPGTTNFILTDYTCDDVLNNLTKQIIKIGTGTRSVSVPNMGTESYRVAFVFAYRVLSKATYDAYQFSRVIYDEAYWAVSSPKSLGVTVVEKSTPPERYTDVVNKDMEVSLEDGSTIKVSEIFENTVNANVINSNAALVAPTEGTVLFTYSGADTTSGNVNLNISFEASNPIAVTSRYAFCVISKETADLTLFTNLTNKQIMEEQKSATKFVEASEGVLQSNGRFKYSVQAANVPGALNHAVYIFAFRYASGGKLSRNNFIDVTTKTQYYGSPVLKVGTTKYSGNVVLKGDDIKDKTGVITSLTDLSKVAEDWNLANNKTLSAITALPLISATVPPIVYDSSANSSGNVDYKLNFFYNGVVIPPALPAVDDSIDGFCILEQTVLPNTADGLPSKTIATPTAAKMLTNPAARFLDARDYVSVDAGTYKYEVDMEETKAIPYRVVFIFAYRAITSGQKKQIQSGTTLVEIGDKEKKSYIVSAVVRTHPLNTIVVDGVVTSPSLFTGELYIRAGLRDSYGTTIAINKLSETISDFDKTNNTSIAKIVAVTNLALSYNSIGCTSGNVNLVIDFDFAGSLADIDGFVYYEATKDGQGTIADVGLATLFGNVNSRFIDVDATVSGTHFTVEIEEAKPTLFRTVFVCAFREVYDTTYKAANKLSTALKPGLLTFGKRFFIVSPIARSNLSGNLYQPQSQAIIKAGVNVGGSRVITLSDAIGDWDLANNGGLAGNTDTVAAPTYPLTDAMIIEGGLLATNINITANWLYTIVQIVDPITNELINPIDGFLVYLLEDTNTSPGTVINLNDLTVKKTFVTTDVTKRSYKFEAMPIKKDKNTLYYYNVAVFAYRVISEATYTKGLKTSSLKPSLKRPSAFNTPMCISSSTSYALTANASYVLKDTKGALPHDYPIGGDFWLNTAGYAVAGIPHLQVGYYNNAGWSPLTEDEVIKKFNTAYASKTGTIHEYSSPLEPINYPGFYWKNTSGEVVSGVAPNGVVYWDVTRLMWQPKVAKTAGKVTEGDPAIIVPYEGTVLLSTVLNSNGTKTLYRGRNGQWEPHVQLSTSEIFTTEKLMKANKVATKAFVTGTSGYFTRTINSKGKLPEWPKSATDIFAKSLLVGNVLPTLIL
jgi:hypothetical protein